MPDEEKLDQDLEPVEEPKVDETKYIPIERFNEVYGKYKEYERSLADYKKYGAPDEIRAKHEKLTQWEKAVDEAKKAASATPDEKQAAERAARVRKELLAIFPELAGLTKLSDFEKAITELRGTQDEETASATLKEHSATLAGLLKENGIDLKHQDKIENYLVALMSEEEKQAFVLGDFDVVKPIFEAELKEGGLLAPFVKKAGPLPPALRNPAGGTIVKGKAPKPLTMKEAEELGWARMNSGGE